MVKRQNIATILSFGLAHRLDIISLIFIKLLKLFSLIETSYENILQNTLLLAPDIVAINTARCDNSSYLNLITKIRKDSPRTRVFIVANDTTQAFDAIQNGASSYAYTSSSSYGVVRKLYNAINDRCPIDPDMASHILAYTDQLILRERYTLTSLQEEILFLLAKKESTSKVRKELDILKSDLFKITGDILLKISENNLSEHDTNYSKPRTSIYHHPKVPVEKSHFFLWIRKIGNPVFLRRGTEYTLYHIAKWFKDTDFITILSLCIIGQCPSLDNINTSLQKQYNTKKN